ncbi:MAG: triose-phosphate isomerase [Deltaproteobacteria bacterium]|nr:MAG: triose-phosphate isomerase [Deltaproteobacteria bacterium]
MTRRPFIAGNWKMHKGPVQADALAAELKRLLMDFTGVDLAVAPPYVSIPAVVARLKHSGIAVAGQDLHDQVQGAYTSAISGEMLVEAGCSHVIVGHSERRSLFGDTDEVVAAKLRAALRAGLSPILCVGETLAQRDAGRAHDVVTGQLALALAGLSPDQVLGITIAYEPVWAIGTGRTASPAQAQEMHATIRSWLSDRYPREVPATVRIQYGGSVKPGNARGLLSQPDIDGALVGGASLDATSFRDIVAAAG